jgi:hypothetical protein
VVMAEITWEAAMVKCDVGLVKIHGRGLSNYWCQWVGVPRQNTRRSPFCRGLPFKGVLHFLFSFLSPRALFSKVATTSCRHIDARVMNPTFEVNIIFKDLLNGPKSSMDRP